MLSDPLLSGKELAERAVESYRENFQSSPAVLSQAPGRLEILGNHTDYNNGFILSIALDLSIVIAGGQEEVSPRRLAAWSSGFNERVEAGLEEILPAEDSWINYPLGVLREIRESGIRLPSINIAVESSLPVGAGVSSSAALELATAEAAYGMLGGRPATPLEQAQLCQRAENDFVGVPCGILDQFSSLFGLRDHVLFLDCDTLHYDRIPLPDSEVAVVIADSGVQHELVDGKYAGLRSHCRRATQKISELLERKISSLRQVSLEEFTDCSEYIEEEDRRRAEHVIRENSRVLAGVEALRRGDLGKLGELMLQSHSSSRDLFGNSCAELDFLIESAAELPGFIGGKLSGGGFGGATVNLVEQNAAVEFQHRLEESCRNRLKTPARTFLTTIGDGARLLGNPQES
ncbi:MAG: galactokinase [Planctomycetota bacterium]